MYPDRALALPHLSDGSASFQVFQMTLCCNCAHQVFSLISVCFIWHQFSENDQWNCTVLCARGQVCIFVVCSWVHTQFSECWKSSKPLCQNLLDPNLFNVCNKKFWVAGMGQVQYSAISHTWGGIKNKRGVGGWSVQPLRKCVAFPCLKTPLTVSMLQNTGQTKKNRKKNLHLGNPLDPLDLY